MVPAAIIGASGFYKGSGVVQPSLAIQMDVSNVVCEGLCPVQCTTH